MEQDAEQELNVLIEKVQNLKLSEKENNQFERVLRASDISDKIEDLKYFIQNHEALLAAEEALLAAEEARAAAEKALNDGNGVGFLIQRGIPPLFKSQVSTSQPNYGTHAAIGDSVFLESSVDVGIPNRCLLANLPTNLKSNIWKAADGEPRMLRNWNNESHIENWVALVLRDVVDLLGFSAQLSVCCQISLTLVKELIPDILIFKIGGILAGVCEVKQPTYYKTDLTTIDVNLQNQITNYLQQMKYVHGIQTPIGIITTYQEWRVCFLRESFDLMVSNGLSNSTCQTTSSAAPLEKEGRIQLFVSRVYKFDEPALIEVLAATIDKMLSSASSAPTSLIRSSSDQQRKFGFVNETSFEWKALPKDLTTDKLTYEMPLSNTKWFYFIQDFHGGRDGRVWLAMTDAGKLAVLKMSKDRSYEQEVKNWKAIWGIKDVRTITLKYANAMIMPVVFHGGDDGEGENYLRFFRPIEPKWSAGKCTDTDVRNSEVRCTFDDSLKKYYDNPNLAAREAITAMAEKGYEHLDLHWRHVGLLPYKKENSTDWAVRPILIDLNQVNHFAVDMDETQKQEKVKEVISESLEKLNIRS